MSMRDYAVDDYGLVFNDEHLKILASKLCDDYTDEDFAEDECGFCEEVADKLALEYIGDFTGEAMNIKDDGSCGWDGDTYNSDLIYYLRLSEYPTLFKAAYNSVDDAINELKERVGEYLPEDFPYREYLRHIVGTYFG